MGGKSGGEGKRRKEDDGGAIVLRSCEKKEEIGQSGHDQNILQLVSLLFNKRSIKTMNETEERSSYRQRGEMKFEKVIAIRTFFSLDAHLSRKIETEEIKDIEEFLCFCARRRKNVQEKEKRSIKVRREREYIHTSRSKRLQEKEKKKESKRSRSKRKKEKDRGRLKIPLVENLD